MYSKEGYDLPAEHGRRLSKQVHDDGFVLINMMGMQQFLRC